MISLSIYCSTQTMSVALYKGQILLDIQKKKIAKNKIDYLPLIVKKTLTSAFKAHALEGLVLGCIEADFWKKMLILIFNF